MKRARVSPLPRVGADLVLEAGESHHLAGVLRSEVGERIELIDGAGGLALAEITACRKKRVAVRILEKPVISRESPLHLELVLAIPHQLSTVDQLLPGLVQLGVDRIWLATCAYSGRIKKDGERYLARLHEIALQALKQSGRLVPPNIELAPNWDGLCRDLKNRLDRIILFHPGYPRMGAGMSPTENGGSLALMIGAEGGFSRDEVATAAACGIQIHGLGPRILKLETAAIGACYWAQQQLGDLS